MTIICCTTNLMLPVIILGTGILTHNVGKEVHLGVLLGQLQHNIEYNLESLQREVAIFFNRPPLHRQYLFSSVFLFPKVVLN
jgi:hypothetical protein